MNKKGQSSLEYLMSYGWALVMVVIIVGILVFIISSPAKTDTFSITNSTEIMLKGGIVQDTTAIAILQNITGGEINIIDISESGNYTNCTINEELADIDIAAGAVMELNCPLSGQDPTGTVTITYKNIAGLQKTASIDIQGDLVNMPPIFFQKTDYGAEEDCITVNLCIARGNKRPLYNSVTEAGYVASSPDLTQWATGTCASPSAFDTFENTAGGNPPALIGQDTCLYLTIDNEYYDLVFSQWTQGIGGVGQGGGFAYTRTRYIS